MVFKENISMKIYVRSNNQLDWTALNEALTSKTSPERLTELSKHSNDVIRTHVASNPNTPESVRKQLLKDESVAYGLKVKESVNPATSPKRLAELALDDSEDIRSNVAMNESTPVKVLKQLASDPSETVQEGLRWNPNSPTYMLRK